MNDPAPPASSRRYWPLGQLVLARVREFYREPEALFWVYGFPILIVVALGIAFRNKKQETECPHSFAFTEFGQLAHNLAPRLA